MARASRKASLDRSSPLPLYAQVRQSLEERLGAGEWKPGDRIPGEPELCREYGVSRPVVRQALQDLAAEGVILRRKGLGTFVAEPKVVSRSLVHSLVGFYQDMERKGLATETQVLDQSLQPAGESIGAKLKIPSLEPVVKITRLRSVGGQPVVLVTSYLPYALCPGLIQVDLRGQSLYAYLEREYGLRVASGRRQIEAVLATEEESRHLNVDRGSPLLRLESISYLAGGRPMEFFNGVFLSRFEVELGHAMTPSGPQDDAVPLRYAPENPPGSSDRKAGG
ncbi:MAG TPA: GntR family transcriptional regulator [Anaerolineales bacterium]|nr:GntR family transcriptional regulator [Anaerolineales bacterium]